MPRRYIERKDVATMIRRDLRAKFPRTRFSVRSESYAGGGAIRVRWTDGPTEKQVEQIARAYESSGFDGMIDLAYSYDHWLLPDGTVQLARTPGTTGSMGSVELLETAPPHVDAELVHLCSGYVTCTRELSDGYVAAVKRAYAALTPHERFELIHATSADRASFRRPDSWSLDDPELRDFGCDAEAVFRTMARRLPAGA